MTACILNFAVPPERLAHDVSKYMEPELGPTWPQEAHNVVLHNLKTELQGSQQMNTPLNQLDSRGFAVLKDQSKALGSLASQAEWNEGYLAETANMIKQKLGADEVFVWNSVTRSADPSINTAYGKNHFQDKAIKGLQFGSTIRPVASGAHVDQDAPNSRRMCESAAGADVFGKFSRVQQLNVWRPLKGPVTSKPLAVCDGTTVSNKAKNVHMGLFGSRVIVHYDEAQRWYYIKQQEPDEAFILKIYDSQVKEGHAEFTPHTGVDELFSADGPETPRESIEVRLVACYH